MTGRLNPRRYDLGELRDAVREPHHQRTVGESIARIDRETALSPQHGSSHGGSEDAGADRPVPVEPITDTRPPRTGTEASRSRPSDDPDEAADERSQTATDAAREESPVRGTDSTSDPRPVGASASDPARTADRTPSEAADDVESYLRSRHHRRGATRPSDGLPGESERRPSRRGARSGDREPRTESVTEGPGRTPNATALLAELSGPVVSKPYLDRLPDAYTAQLEVLEWLEWMLAAAGHDGTLAALAYYESIGWLSERSREALEDVAAGLSAPQATGRTLGIDDHRESLVHVAKLAHRRRR